MPYVKREFSDKPCSVCGTIFTPRSGTHCYCSIRCKRIEYRRGDGVETTARQYELISGNWEKYFGRLCTKAFRRELLSKHDCLDLLKAQEYKCALTGTELTCILARGQVCRTNASIDRIDPKGIYVKENVQLVCAAVNKFRIDTPLDEFIDWCKKVSEYALRK